jgi:hypothetical protein
MIRINIKYCLQNTETDEDSKAKQRAELDSVKNRSDDLKSIMAHQMDELNEKKKMVSIIK